MRINSERLLNDINRLAQIGSTPEGGVSRPAFSGPDLEGRVWFEERLKEAGLMTSMDGAGNQTGLLRSRHPNAKRLLIGSHLDSVPNGGRYDGPLGTLSALEAARVLIENEVELPFDLEVINFTDEEGTFLGEFGSHAFIGHLTPEMLEQSRGGRAELETRLGKLGLTVESALNSKRDPSDYCGFLELHIEQGSRLESSDTDIGIVSGVVGIRSFWLTFHGEAAHGGAKPVAERRDALVGASEFILKSRQMTLGRFFPGVTNCGMISSTPGAFNVVPAKVRLSVEFRHGSEEELDLLQYSLVNLAHQVAERFDLHAEIEMRDRVIAAPAGREIMQAFETACQHLSLSHTELLSFAGHDTQAMSRFTRSGMIFVPSVNGISHNPKEFTHSQDCVNGGNVLLNAILEIKRKVDISEW